MNETDKELYHALNLISRRNRTGISQEQKEKVFNIGMIQTIIEADYARNHENTILITQTGLEELRKLENILRNEWATLLSIIAMILSFVSLAISIFTIYIFK